MRALCLSPLLAILLTGCFVKNQQYRLLPGPNGTAGAKGSTFQVPAQQKLPANKPLADGEKCTADSLAVRPCLAFLEFDDMGERWSPQAGPVKTDGAIDDSSQLSNALQLVAAAVRRDPHAIIVTFTHGWKHNAKPGDTNIEGFKQVLNYLHDDRYQNRVVVGIYISWRGDLVSPYMPVRRNFSYFNREAAAIRIPGASLTDALIRIADTAHNPGAKDAKGRPLVIFVGHSFGGLVMERALSQATIHQVDESGDPLQYKPLADLVVFVNSAAAATEAKQTLDLLAATHFRYSVDGKRDLPLFLSVSSSADLATRVGLPIGHGIPFLGYKIDGSLRDHDPLTCYDPAKGGASTFNNTQSQGAFYLSTAAHMPILQSHDVVEDTTIPFKDCALGNSSNPATVFTYALPDIGRCFRVEEKANRCNGTPYWLMEIDPAIVPDHGTIFTFRFVEFLAHFLPTPDDMNRDIRPALTVQ